jgi:hypothetical protein
MLVGPAELEMGLLVALMAAVLREPATPIKALEAEQQTFEFLST